MRARASMCVCACLKDWSRIWVRRRCYIWLLKSKGQRGSLRKINVQKEKQESKIQHLIFSGLQDAWQKQCQGHVNPWRTVSFAPHRKDEISSQKIRCAAEKEERGEGEGGKKQVAGRQECVSVSRKFSQMIFSRLTHFVTLSLKLERSARVMGTKCIWGVHSRVTNGNQILNVKHTAEYTHIRGEECAPEVFIRWLTCGPLIDSIWRKNTAASFGLTNPSLEFGLLWSTDK